jgi:hydroxypyruvate reductase
MAAAIEDILAERITKGTVNVKYGYANPLSRVKIVEAGHPLPDHNGLRGSQIIYDLLHRAGQRDLVICLISGGGSSLLPLPVPPISLSDKQSTTEALLACGARINEVNAVRKHLSRLKGGQLARAGYPAAIVCLILSDVVGDCLDVIASGPCVPDPSTFQDCMEVLARYAIADRLPKSILRHFEAGLAGMVPETPKSGDPVFGNVIHRVVGNNRRALAAARDAAEKLGYHAMVLSSLIEGETRDVAGVHTAIAKEIQRTQQPLASPACVLSGGETTVTLRGKGKGGRNQEFALAGAIDIEGEREIVLLCAGTDGTDGPTAAAGAIADTQTVGRAMTIGMDPRQYLANNDAYHFFNSLGDLVITGPTRTNVMDLRILLVRSASA